MSDTIDDEIAAADLAAWDMAKQQLDDTCDAMFRQNITYHDRICDLEKALRLIAGKKKLDACAAASMRAIARSALSDTSQLRPQGE